MFNKKKIERYADTLNAIAYSYKSLENTENYLRGLIRSQVTEFMLTQRADEDLQAALISVMRTRNRLVMETNELVSTKFYKKNHEKILALQAV